MFESIRARLFGRPVKEAKAVRFVREDELDLDEPRENLSLAAGESVDRWQFESGETVEKWRLDEAGVQWYRMTK